jgi:ADP-ribose pyrophosphatase YjhB (NUDIX family)
MEDKSQMEHTSTPSEARLSIDTTPPEARDWPEVRYATGGGVVIRDGQVLLLKRLKKQEIRLPKGHVEAGETVAECAIREVREESGAREPLLVRQLGTVENRFAKGGERFLRHETWYLMSTPDEMITEHEPQWQPTWYPLDQAEQALTFEAERVALRWARAALEI